VRTGNVIVVKQPAEAASKAIRRITAASPRSEIKYLNGAVEAAARIENYANGKRLSDFVSRS